MVPITDNGATVSINADLDGAKSAKLRIGLSLASTREEEVAGILPEFTLNLNGSFVEKVPSQRFGREDLGMTVREFDVPISALLDGFNFVNVDFGSSGGHIISAVLEIVRAVGDFNNSGVFDAEDRSLLIRQTGNPVTDSTRDFDLNLDGNIDQLDVDFWDQLQGS